MSFHSVLLQVSHGHHTMVRPANKPDFDFGDMFTLVHDVFEHVTSDPGDVEHELAAIGAMFVTRNSLRPEGVAYDFLTTFTENRPTGYLRRPPKFYKVSSVVDKFIDACYLSYCANMTNEGIDELPPWMTGKYLNVIKMWVEFGKRRAETRYHSVLAHGVDLPRQLENLSMSNDLLKFIEPTEYTRFRYNLISNTYYFDPIY